MKFLNIKLLLLFAVFPQFVLAMNAPYYFGVSAYSPSLMGQTTTDSAKKDLFSPFQYPLTFGYSMSIGSDSRFLPQLSYTILPRKSPDGGSEVTHLLLELPYLQQFASVLGNPLEWKLGLVLHQQKIVGKGGTIDLANGSSTATFNLPDHTSTINTIITEAGLAYQYERVLTQTTLLVEAPFNNKKRSYGFLLSLTYNFGGY